MSSSSCSAGPGAGASAASTPGRPRLVMLEVDPKGWPCTTIPSVSEIVHDEDGDAFELSKDVYHLIALEVDGAIVACSGKCRVTMRIIDERDPDDGAKLLTAYSSRPWKGYGTFYFKAVTWKQASRYRIFCTLHDHPVYKSEDEYEPLEIFVHAKDAVYEQAEAAKMRAWVDQQIEDAQKESARIAGYKMQPLTKKEREWLDAEGARVGRDPPSHIVLQLCMNMQRVFDSPAPKDVGIVSAHFESDTGKAERQRLENERRELLAQKGALLVRRLKSQTSSSSSSGGAGAGLGAASSGSSSGISGVKNSATLDAIRARLLAPYSRAAAGSSEADRAGGAEIGSGSHSISLGVVASSSSSSSTSSGRGLPSFVRAAAPARRVSRKPDLPLKLAGPGEEYEEAWETALHWMAVAREEEAYAMASVRGFDALMQRSKKGEDTNAARRAMIKSKLKGKRSEDIVTAKTLRLHRHDPIPAGTGVLLASNHEAHVLFHAMMAKACQDWLKWSARWAGRRFKVIHAEWKAKEEKLKVKGAAGFSVEPSLGDEALLTSLVTQGMSKASRLDVENIQVLRSVLECGRPPEKKLFDQFDGLEKLTKARRLARRKKGKAGPGGMEEDEEEVMKASVAPALPLIEAPPFLPHTLQYRLRRIPLSLTRVSRTVTVDAGVGERPPPSPRHAHASAASDSSRWPRAYGTLQYRRIPWREDDASRGTKYHAGTLLEHMWRTGQAKRPAAMYPFRYPAGMRAEDESTWDMLWLQALARGDAASSSSAVDAVAGAGITPTTSSAPTLTGQWVNGAVGAMRSLLKWTGGGVGSSAMPADLPEHIRRRHWEPAWPDGSDPTAPTDAFTAPCDPRVPLSDEPAVWPSKWYLTPTVWSRPRLVYPTREDGALLDKATEAFFRQEPRLSADTGSLSAGVVDSERGDAGASAGAAGPSSKRRRKL